MTQYSKKLWDYISSEFKSNGKCHFTVQEVFLNSGIDFGDMDMISRAVDDLVNNNLVEQNEYLGEGFQIVK